jgi:hypothetical protein
MKLGVQLERIWKFAGFKHYGDYFDLQERKLGRGEGELERNSCSGES